LKGSIVKKRTEIPPPKDQERRLSVAEADAFEESLRLAAGAYYEVEEIKPPKQKSWLENKPPGIIRRFEAMRNKLLPGVKYKKKMS